MFLSQIPESGSIGFNSTELLVANLLLSPAMDKIPETGSIGFNSTELLVANLLLSPAMDFTMSSQVGN
jgi:hypothetical protein